MFYTDLIKCFRPIRPIISGLFIMLHNSTCSLCFYNYFITKMKSI